MSTFAADIEKYAERLGEPIKAIVIGDFGWGNDGPIEIPEDKRGVVLSWEQAREFLAYDYDTGYGGVECHSITVWTDDTVFYVWQYDGATGFSGVPRNPVPHDPDMPGG